MGEFSSLEVDLWQEARLGGALCLMLAALLRANTVHRARHIRPREWFLVEPSIISEAIGRLKDGSIVRCRYDASKCAIVEEKD